jgi:hypothetical protein
VTFYHPTTAGVGVEFRIYRNGVYQPGTLSSGHTHTTALKLNTIGRDFIGEPMETDDTIELYVSTPSGTTAIHTSQFSLSGSALTNAVKLPPIGVDTTVYSTPVVYNSGVSVPDSSPDFIYDTLWDGITKVNPHIISVFYE